MATAKGVVDLHTIGQILNVEDDEVRDLLTQQHHEQDRLDEPHHAAEEGDDFHRVKKQQSHQISELHSFVPKSVATSHTATVQVRELNSGQEGEGEDEFVRADQVPVADAREAFLLSIPTAPPDARGSTYSSITGMETAANVSYILALPDNSTRQKEQLDEQLDDSLWFGSTVVGSMILPSLATRDMTLPTDIISVELQVTDEGNDGGIHLDARVDKSVPLIGYAILVSSLLALASIGAALDLQGDSATAEMKTFWRFFGTAIFFLSISFRSFREEVSRLEGHSLWVDIPTASLAYTVLCVNFAKSLELTSLVNAFVLSNMASLLLIALKVVRGLHSPTLEWGGALVGFSGALVCAATSSVDVDEQGLGRRLLGNELTGNLLAFSCSVATVVYLSMAKKLRTRIDLMVFMSLIFIWSSAYLGLYIVAFQPETYELSFDPDRGLFGWLNLRADRLPLEIAIVVVCNGIGTCGYVAVMKYVDPVLVSCAMLLEPVVATLEGLIAGVTQPPTIEVWLGDLVVIIGSLMVIHAGSRTSETVDVSKALQQKDYANGSMLTSILLKSPMISALEGKEDLEIEFECVFGTVTGRLSR